MTKVEIYVLGPNLREVTTIQMVVKLDMHLKRGPVQKYSINPSI